MTISKKKGDKPEWHSIEKVIPDEFWEERDRST